MTTMKNGIRLRWKIYAFLYIPLALSNLTSLFYPKSDPYVYYHALAAFHKALYVFYIVHILSAVLGILSASLLLLYVTRTEFLPRAFWKWILILRIIFDCSDHQYEISLIKSLFYVNLSYVLITLLITTALILPSYFVFYKYLSKPKDLFSK